MNSYEPAGACPVCLTEGLQMAPDGYRDAYRIRCANCGDHVISGTAVAQLRNSMRQPLDVARLAHAVVRVPADTVISAPMLEQLVAATPLPAVAERIDNLLLWTAAQTEPGHALEFLCEHLRAVIGTLDTTAAMWVVDEACRLGYLEEAGVRYIGHPMSHREVRMTSRGWQRHQDLMRDGARSQHAFMAMEFNAEMWALFHDHLQPAVAAAGFELRTTDHPGKTAGLIDNRMRVDIRTARFVVCDLTDGNRGAYWEAGFAEGIGRPVFYTCRQDVLRSEAKATKPHFDAAHQSIVAWDPADPAAGMAELKAMIRATLPAEARMEDS